MLAASGKFSNVINLVTVIVALHQRGGMCVQFRKQTQTLAKTRCGNLKFCVFVCLVFCKRLLWISSRGEL